MLGIRSASQMRHCMFITSALPVTHQLTTAGFPEHDFRTVSLVRKRFADTDIDCAMHVL